MDLVSAAFLSSETVPFQAPEVREWLESGVSIGMGVSIWDYTDYRVFLRESFASAKAMGNPVSNRWLAKRLGFKSFSFITMLLQGKRNLTRPNREKFSRLLGLSEEEDDYFAALVDFNQARDPGDQERALRTLSILQRPGNKRRISTQTIGVTPEGYERICSLIQDFRRQVELIQGQEGPGDIQLFHLGVQFFPLPFLGTEKPETFQRTGESLSSRLPGMD